MKNGRPKLSLVESKNREYVRQSIAFSEVQCDFLQRISAGAERSKREKHQLRDNAFRRVQLWTSIDAVNEKIREARASGNARLEEALKGARTEHYAALNAIPQVGYTQSEWRDQEEVAETRVGRPQVGIDAAYSRASRRMEEARKALQAAVTETGERPAPLSEVIKKVSADKSGRPKNLRVDSLRNAIDALDADIQYILSGHADKDRQAWIAERMKLEGVDSPDQLSGRPYVPLSDMLTERMARRSQLEAEYQAAVVQLTPAQRRKHLARSVSIALSRAERKAANDEDADGASRWGASDVRRMYALEKLRKKG